MKKGNFLFGKVKKLFELVGFLIYNLFMLNASALQQPEPHRVVAPA
jgi:hypothetical protein